MPGRYLLDTTAVVALFRRDPAVVERMKEADETFVSVITLGELYYGAEKSTRRAENTAQVANFAAAIQSLGGDEETARLYGTIKNELRTRGKPIPENDMWIAAAALRHGLSLAHRDGHFSEVTGLVQERW